MTGVCRRPGWGVGRRVGGEFQGTAPGVLQPISCFYSEPPCQTFRILFPRVPRLPLSSPGAEDPPRLWHHPLEEADAGAGGIISILLEWGSVPQAAYMLCYFSFRQSTGRWQNKKVPLLQRSRSAPNPSVTLSTFPVSGLVSAAHSGTEESLFIPGLGPQDHSFMASVFDWVPSSHVRTRASGCLCGHQPFLPRSLAGCGPGLRVGLLNLVLAPLLVRETFTGHLISPGKHFLAWGPWAPWR